MPKWYHTCASAHNLPTWCGWLCAGRMEEMDEVIYPGLVALQAQKSRMDLFSYYVMLMGWHASSMKSATQAWRDQVLAEAWEALKVFLTSGDVLFIYPWGFLKGGYHPALIVEERVMKDGVEEVRFVQVDMTGFVCGGGLFFHQRSEGKANARFMLDLFTLPPDVVRQPRLYERVAKHTLLTGAVNWGNLLEALYQGACDEMSRHISRLVLWQAPERFLGDTAGNWGESGVEGRRDVLNEMLLRWTSIGGNLDDFLRELWFLLSMQGRDQYQQMSWELHHALVTFMAQQDPEDEFGWMSPARDYLPEMICRWTPETDQWLTVLLDLYERLNIIPVALDAEAPYHQINDALLRLLHQARDAADLEQAVRFSHRIAIGGESDADELQELMSSAGLQWFNCALHDADWPQAHRLVSDHPELEEEFQRLYERVMPDRKQPWSNFKVLLDLSQHSGVVRIDPSPSA
ncbi:MAG: hypothetical protein HOE53_04180 [Candidatus Magasanikbacteria bacterium]|nr:hypothetical protein [Candidatus Magasanikbacteria bacterium]